MNTTCPSCKCNNTVKGDFNREPYLFFPKGLRFFTFSRFVELQERFYACLECGLVWSHVDGDELKNLIKKSAKPETRENLKL